MGSVTAATQGLTVVMTALVPPTQAATASLTGLGAALVPLAPAMEAADIFLAELVPEASAAAVSVGAFDASLAGLPPIAVAAAAGLQATGIVMAEIVPEAVVATAATDGLIMSMLAAAAPIAAVAAIAAAVLLPVLAAIDNAMGGTLSDSGYYPEWLKNIGDVMLSFTPIGIVIQVVVAAFQQLWSVVTAMYEAFTNIAAVILGPVKLAVGAVMTAFSMLLKTALFPLHAALFAINAPFRAFHLAVDLVKGTLNLAQAAVVRFADGIRALPGLAASAASSLARLGQSMASATWDAYAATVNAIGSGLQNVGKTMAIAGAGMAALGALIVTPLAKAAETFAHHGKEVAKIADEYEISAEAAGVYAYMASQTGRSVKDLTSVVKEGSNEYAKWNKIAYESGWTIGATMKDGADSAVSLASAYEEAKDALHGLWVQLGRAVAPAVEESTRLFAGAVRAVVSWVRNNQELIATAFKVGSTIAAVGSALATAGGVLMTVGAAMTPFTVALAGIAGGLAIVEYQTKTGVGIWEAYRESLFNVFGKIKEFIAPAIAEVEKVVGGIKDAVMGGRLDLAFTIVIEEVKAVWAGGLAWLAEKTGGVFGDILANLAAGQWQAAADGAMGVVTAAFWRANQKIDDAWEGVKSIAATVWTAIQDGFDGALTAVEAGFVRLLDKLKGWGISVLQFFKDSVVDPIAEALSNSTLATFLGITNIANKASVGIVNAQEALQKSKNKTDPEKESEKLFNAADERRTGRHKDAKDAQDEADAAAVGRRTDRDEAIKTAEGAGKKEPAGKPLSRSDTVAAKELSADWQKDVDTLWETAAKKATKMQQTEDNPDVYDAVKQAAATREWEEAHKRAAAEDKKLTEFKADIERRSGPVAQAQAGVDAATQARDEAIAAAKKAKDEMGTPEDPDEKDKKDKKDKNKGGSGFTTTSAYAFGQLGSGDDPAKSQLEETKKAREEAKESRKQRDKDWAEILRIMKAYGLKSPDEAREVIHDMTG